MKILIGSEMSSEISSSSEVISSDFFGGYCVLSYIVQFHCYLLLLSDRTVRDIIVLHRHVQ